MIAARGPDAGGTGAADGTVLPPVRGRLVRSAPLAHLVWFRVGGPAELLFRPADLDDLTAFLQARPAGLPVFALGVGSNLLIRDGGIPGIVVKLTGPFAAIEVDVAAHAVVAGAGALSLGAAKAAAAAGIGGLEFLSGIPGTIGGALRMNAGAYGGETARVLAWAEAIDPAGRLHRLDAAEMGFRYRHSAVPPDWIFVRARLCGEPDDPAAVATRMARIHAAREASQPLRTRTGGSTFTNPPGAKAWELIDRAGCRGLRIGGALVSPKHCNFLINDTGASAAELEALGEEVRRRVRETSGVELEWEIRRVGRPGGGHGGRP